MASGLAKDTAEAAIKMVSAGARVGGTNAGGSGGDAVQLLADHIDITWDLVKEVGKGAKSKGQLATLLALKLGAVGNVVPNQYAKCGIAVMSLSAGLVLAAAEIAGGVSAPIGFATAISVLSDFYATSVDCSGPAGEIAEKAQSQLSEANRTLEYMNTVPGAIWLMRAFSGY